MTPTTRRSGSPGVRRSRRVYGAPADTQRVSPLGRRPSHAHSEEVVVVQPLTGTDREWVAGTTQTITLTGLTTPVLVHGVINPEDITANRTTLIQGTYSDTLTVTLTL